MKISLKISDVKTEKEYAVQLLIKKLINDVMDYLKLLDAIKYVEDDSE